MLKNRTMKQVVAAGVTAMAMMVASAAPAAVLSDFENGALDYDNSVSQTTGKFRDITTGANINLSNNGGANDFLNIGGSSSTHVFAYDTTPADTVPTLFTIGANQVAMLSVDLNIDLGTNSHRDHFYLTLYDPASSGTNKGVAAYYNARPGSSAALSLAPLTTVTTGAFGTNFAFNSADIYQGDARLILTFTNNANNTGADLVASFYRLDALEGTIGTQIGPDATFSITYGNSDPLTQVDFDPANTGLAILLVQKAPASGQLDKIDYLQFTVVAIPEPASLALLALGGLFMLPRSRKGRSQSV